MRERSLKRTSVLLAVLFGLVAALTGFALFFGGSSKNASADTAPTEKVLYFADCGLVKSHNGGIAHDEGDWGSWWTEPTWFMETYGLAYGSAENPDGLLNHVADKPFFTQANDVSDLTSIESEIDDGGKAWGFVLYKDGAPSTLAYGTLNGYRTAGTDIDAPGFNTTRFVNKSDDMCSLAYKFEVGDDPVNIIFGTGNRYTWGGRTFNVRVNSAAAVNDVVADNVHQNTYCVSNISGVEETYGSVTKKYVTIEFCCGNRNQEEGAVSWILVTTPSYALDVADQTSCVKGGETGSVDLMPVWPGNTAPNQTFYAHGTLDETEMAKINAAEDFTYVEGVKVTLDDGREKTVKVLALPSYTTYFVDAGLDAAYGAKHGYGYTEYTGNENARWVKTRYDETLRYVAANGEITYKFDNLSAGSYGVKVGSEDPWESRTTTIELNGKPGANLLESEAGVKHSATNYITLDKAGDLTVGLRKGTSKGPAFTYIWVYAMEEVITYNTHGGSSITASVREPGSTTAVAVTSNEPSRSGYIFRGWYTQETGGNKVEAGTEYTSATTLHAQWQEALPHNVTFMADGTTHATVENVPYDAVIDEDDRPEVPTKAGYYFAGWFDGETEFDPATDHVTTNLTVVAHWNVDPLAEEDDYTVVSEKSATSFAIVSKWEGDVLNGGKLLYLPVGKKAVAVYTLEGGTGYNAGIVLSFLYTSNNGSKVTRYNCAPNAHYGFNNATETTKGDWWNNSYAANAQLTGGPSANHGTVYGDDTKKVTQYALIERADATHITLTLKTYNTEAELPYKDVLCQTTYSIELPDATNEDFAFHFVFDAETNASVATTLKTASIKYVTVNNTIYDLVFDENHDGETATEKKRGGTQYTIGSKPRTGYMFDGWKKGNDEPVPTGTTITVTGNATYVAQWTPKTYTVSYNLDGGAFAETPAAKTVTYDAAVGELPTPTKTGHTFDGWYTQATGGDKVTSTSNWTIDGGDNGATVTLYAKWTANTYTITYELDGGTNENNAPTSYTYGTGATLPTPTKTGYRFDGWFDAATGGTQVTSISATDTGNQTLYAKWTINRYTVTFNAQGGSTVAAATVDYNNKVTKPTDPTKTGYTFDGWYKEAACTTAWNFDSDVVTDDVTLHAKWNANKYTITYDVKGGSALASTTKQVTYGAAVGTLPTTTKTGYTFAGWYTEETGGTKIESTTTWTYTDVTELYAQWTAKQYTLTLNAGEDGSVDPATKQVTYNAAVGELPTPTKTGYTFDGWFTAETNGTKIESTTTWTYTDVTELYAQWTAKEYTITWDANDGSFVTTPDSTTVSFGDTLTPPAEDQLTPPTGKILASWNTKADGTGVEVGTDADALAVDLGESPVTLYAQWIVDTTVRYTVTFNLNYDGAGTPPASKKVVENGTIASLPTPTRPGYTLEGWYTAAEGGTKFEAGTTPVTENTPLYAHWAVKQYTLTLNPGEDGSVDPATKQVTYNAAVGELPTPSKTGHTFDGWYTAATGGTKIQSDTTWTYTTVTALHAHWTVIQYTVTFEVNGGSTIVAATVDYNGTVAKPTDPTKTGYTLEGWYKDSACETEWDFAADTVTEDVMIYAKWTANQYTLTLNANGGSVDPATKSVTYNAAVGTLPTPTKSGYTFDGWYTAATDGTKIESSTIWTIADNTTLYAHWTENAVTPPPATTYTVMFDSQGGSTVNAITNVASGSTVTAPTAPTREGYTFGGWYTDANCTTAWNFGTDTVTGNVTLYAKWTENSTPEPTPTPAPSDDSGKKGGCGSSVMAETSAIIAVLMLALAGVVVLKKKAENK